MPGLKGGRIFVWGKEMMEKRRATSRVADNKYRIFNLYFSIAREKQIIQKQGKKSKETSYKHRQQMEQKNFTSPVDFPRDNDIS